MSHEIRTPINAILGMDEMILRECKDEQILVIDDTPMNLSVIRGLLKQTLVQIDTEESGNECLQMIKEKKYDIVFLDHRMPEMDGIETFQAMCEMEEYKEHPMPVIILTANAVSGAREEYMAVGFTDYLTKPVDPEKIESTLIQYLPEKKVSLRKETGEGEQKNPDTRTDADGMPEWLTVSGALDTGEGLKRCGTQEVYISAVKEYLENKKDTADEIEKFYKEEKWKGYTTKVHALKSTSAIIGVMKEMDCYQMPAGEEDRYERLAKAVKNMEWEKIVSICEEIHR